MYIITFSFLSGQKVISIYLYVGKFQQKYLNEMNEHDNFSEEKIWGKAGTLAAG